MRKIKSLFTGLTLIWLVSGSIIKAQDPQNDVELKTPQYMIEIEYAGQDQAMDSTFLVYAVFDQNSIKNVKKVKVKTGKRKDQLIEKSIELNDSLKVKSKNNKIYVLLGKAGNETSIIEVYTENKQNRIQKAKLQKAKP